MTFALCDCTSNLCGSEVNTNGVGCSMLLPVPLRGPVFAVTWCGQLPALTPFAVAAQLTRSRPIFAASGLAQRTDQLMESRRVNICWRKPTATGSHVQFFGSEDASHGPGLNPRTSLPWLRSMDHGHTTLRAGSSCTCLVSLCVFLFVSSRLTPLATLVSRGA